MTLLVDLLANNESRMVSERTEHPVTNVITTVTVGTPNTNRILDTSAASFVTSSQRNQNSTDLLILQLCEFVGVQGSLPGARALCQPWTTLTQPLDSLLFQSFLLSKPTILLHFTTFHLYHSLLHLRNGHSPSLCRAREGITATSTTLGFLLPK